jgi:integrase
MRGVPMGVIAERLGHADTRMVERHYGHLAPSYRRHPCGSAQIRL